MRNEGLICDAGGFVETRHKQIQGNIQVKEFESLKNIKYDSAS